MVKVLLIVALLFVYCISAEMLNWRKYKKAGYTWSEYRIVDQLTDPMFVSYAGYNPDCVERVIRDIKNTKKKQQ
jgi:hypothetical protein